MNSHNKVLIIDDEPDILELLELTLKNMGYSPVKCTNFKQAKKCLSEQEYFLCLTDMRLPDGDGIELVKIIQKKYPQLPVAVITAYGNVEGAVNTLKAGAFDYVSKPISLTMLKDLVSSAKKLSEQAEVNDFEDELIGTSNTIKTLRANILKFARSQAPVFIHGESGVGKELVARLIHKQGPRSTGPFIPVNCGAIPGELMESEFFGHKKGSFTGAVSDHTGLFQAAHGGTLFLDEIAELPLHMQVKLLRAIQEKAIKPIGHHTEISVDVRILSATHKDLFKEVQTNKFRQDLYYRINVIELLVPPLRERIEDVEVLSNFMLEKHSQVYDVKITISPRAIKALQNYAFPGNIRELENILERAIALSENNVISKEDLNIADKILDDASEFLPLDDPLSVSSNLEQYLDEQQKEVIINALEENRWNKTATAKQLGITFRALRYRLKKLGID